MFEPTQRQVDTDLESSMDLFKRAEVGHVAALQPLQPKRVLLALDGSTQDTMGVAIARRLKDRLGCEIAVVDAREAHEPREEAPAYAFLQELGATTLEKKTGEAFLQIVESLQQWQADLLLTPCPFGRDFQSVGVDSVGTVIDVLLARSPVPLIVTRAPFDPKGDVFSRLRLVLSGENEAATAAARWATGLVHPQGHLELLLLVEQEFYENVREAMHSIEPSADISIQSLEHALAKTFAPLHVALHRSARELGFTYDMTVESERESGPFTVVDPAGHPPLLVLALERADHASRGHVQDHVRHSPHPVLVVPG